MNIQQTGKKKAVVRLWLTIGKTTHPSGSAACRRAGLKHFGRLVPHLGVGHDRRGVKRVRVGICGHALLKHNTPDCTLTAPKREPRGPGRLTGRLTKFLCMSSIRFLTLTIMLSNTPKGFLESCAAGGWGQRGRSRYWDQMVLRHYYQLVKPARHSHTQAFAG